MNEQMKKMLANKRLATFRVQSWIGSYTKGEIAKLIGVSRPTLDRRLSTDNWNYKEIEIITEKFPF